jgi:hypothetical protein
MLIENGKLSGTEIEVSVLYKNMMRLSREKWRNALRFSTPRLLIPADSLRAYVANLPPAAIHTKPRRSTETKAAA